MTKQRTPRGELRCTPRSLWKGEQDVPVAKFLIPHKAIDLETRTIKFTISTGAKDRDGDIIEPAGWELKVFNRDNPVVLWAHESFSPPIARAINTKVEGNRLISDAVFATRDEFEFADTIFRLYVGKFLNAVSVGFQPTEMELIQSDDPGEMGFRFTKQELFEFSAVPVPSNPEALMRARTKGIDINPYAEWLTEILDEHAGGENEDLLNRIYVTIKGKLHPVRQDEIAAKNAKTLGEKDGHDDEDEDEDDNKAGHDDDDDRKVLTTGPGGDDSHTHAFKAGDEVTEPGGDDGHVHAITYTDGEPVIIEGNLGHAHDTPAGAEMPDEGKILDSGEDAHHIPADDAQEPESDPEVVAEPDPKEAPEGDDKAAVTDWPQAGMNLPVSLLTSEYRAFPLAEAQALRDDWPEIYRMGGKFSLIDPAAHDETDIHPEKLTGPDEELMIDAIRAREDWAAKHVDDYTIDGVVSQVRHLVRGSRGIEHMRLMLSLAKEAVMNQRDKAKGLSAEEIDAITDRVVTQAVVPAIEKAFKKYTGRL